jgi:hypothetical protein
MKKKLLIIILLQISLTIFCYSQSIMTDIQISLKNLKNDITLKLDSCRTNLHVGDWRFDYLKYFLINSLIYNENSSLHKKTWEEVEKKIDSLNMQFKFNWKMVYDDEMIERIVLLLNNEYRKDELDTLVNRKMALFSQNSGFEQDAMWQMKVDTSKVFLMIKDSLNKHRDREIHPELYQNFDVFLFMNLDTTVRFRIVLDSIIKSKRENVINDFLTQYHFDIQGLIKSCSNLDDEKLVKALINLLNKLSIRTEKLIQMLRENEMNEDINERWKVNNEKTNNINIIDAIRTTLVRIKIEPYHSEFLKRYSYSLKEIKEMQFGGNVEIIVNLSQSQEAFLEISKYLHSSAPTMLTGDDELLGKAYSDAYREIKKYIENKELQDIINDPDFDLDRDRFEIYEWMQKNYGNYEIKILW